MPNHLGRSIYHPIQYYETKLIINDQSIFGCVDELSTQTTRNLYVSWFLNLSMRLTYIYFLIAVTQGSHDYRFDMGRMGVRAGKLRSPEFFDKEVLVLLVRNMCESFDKNGKTKCAHKCFTQSKGFIL